MKKPENIKFILGTKGVIPSVNSIYKAKIIYKYGKAIPTIYKDGSAKKVAEEITEQLKCIDFQTEAAWIFKKDAVFNLNIQFIFKQSFFKRDLDNLMKVVQDTIFRYFGLNDSRVVELHTYKSILPGASEEKICVSLSQSTADVRFDVLEPLPLPERIKISGDKDDVCAKDLGKVGFLCTSEEDDDTEAADCHIHLIRPGDLDSSKVTEILMSSVTAQRCFGTMILGILEDPTSWSNWSDVEKLSEAVKEISGGTKRIVSVRISGPEDIKNYLGTPKKKRKPREKKEE